MKFPYKPAFYSIVQGTGEEYSKLNNVKSISAQGIGGRSFSVTKIRYLKNDFKRNWDLYLLVLPVVIFYLVFHYGPMYGVKIAFLNYNPYKGMDGSPYVGLKYFKTFLELPSAGQYILNTLRISVMSLLFSFPIPIVLALMFNALPTKGSRKVTQMIFYLPHFVSTVVIVGMLQLFTNNQVGVVNQLLTALGGTPIDFNNVSSFLPLYIISGIWSSAGWNTIIYTGALTSVSPELYEAAVVDGASKMQRVRHIDLPALLPTLSITLVLAVGGIMGVGYEKVYLMQTASNISVSEIISTYTYKTGIINGQYSYSAAIGLFNSVVNMVLLFSANAISKRISGMGLW